MKLSLPLSIAVVVLATTSSSFAQSTPDNNFGGFGQPAVQSPNFPKPKLPDPGFDTSPAPSPTSSPRPDTGSFRESNNNRPISTIRSDGALVLSPCTVEFIDDIELPAQESGQIKTLLLREGDPVKSGVSLGRIDDELYLRMLEQAKLKLAIAEQRANDKTSIMAAENEISLATIEYTRTQRLASTGSKSESEREKAEFSLKLAMLKKSAAQNEKDAAAGESQIERARVREVEERIRRHSLVTDFDGYVIEIFRHPLEWVTAGDKVMRIARMDRLHVSGVVNAAERNPHEVLNCPVTVTLQLAGGETAEFKGKIVNVGLERQGPNQILVKAEIENQPIEGHWRLQPGSSVSMTVHLNR